LLFFLSLNLYNNGNLPFAKAQKEKTLQFFITATFSSYNLFNWFLTHYAFDFSGFFAINNIYISNNIC